MKKDIPNYKVEDIAIAIVPREDNELDEVALWDTYIINLKEDAIKNVLVSTYGYGERDGERVHTSRLRHFFVGINGLEILPIEPLQTSLFDLANEFWVSFQYNGHMYDKKYVFVKGSIDAMHFTPIPFIGKMGVMIR
jgi:hypothetical protein